MSTRGNPYAVQRSGLSVVPPTPLTNQKGVVSPPAAENVLSNAGGQVPPTPNQQGGLLNTSIPAGQTVPYQIQGSFFYVVTSSVPLQIRPRGGSFVSYQPGTGYRLPDGQSFAMIEIQNDTAAAASIALFIGFGDFIDNRLILEGSVVQQVMKVTYDASAPAVGPILIPDISGEAFTDQNGAPWLAINRVAFYVDNLSTSSNLLLQDSAADGKSCGIIFPAVTRTFPVSGSFSLKTGAAAVNAGVIEVYNAISPSIPL